MDIHNLNERQQQAVECLEGPLLIMAGAGSGKTRVLTCRIANLLEHGVSADNILAITFTNKAANEMKERVHKMIGSEAKRIWLSTFHSLCVKILRRDMMNLTQLGYTNNFTIYDTADVLGVINNYLKQLDIDEKVLSANNVIHEISQAKNQLIGPMTYTNRISSTDFKQKTIAKIYRLYTAYLRRNNTVDFDDLLMLTVRLLMSNEEVRQRYQQKFKYILVDEYQDTNNAQYQLTRLLADGSRNLCVVGDADQSIYGWRGADISNIMNFKKDYPEATSIMLEQNYRSTKTILEAANNVIQNNKNRIPKDLWTDNSKGEPINIFSAHNEKDEAQFIIDTIKDTTVAYGDIAILYRTNAQSRVIEEYLMKADIPYAIVGGIRFYERKEIKDMLAYLRLVYNLRDNASLLRIINVPKRGIGNALLDQVSGYAEDNNISIFDVISNSTNLDNMGLTVKAKNKLETFANFIKDSVNVSKTKPISVLLNYIMDNSGYLLALENDNTDKQEENQSRIENIKELVSVAIEYENNTDNPTLEHFLSNIALMTDLDNANMGNERVNLMTFHSSKGLEFPIVFMVGMEEGIFPGFRAVRVLGEQMEEERRTCYVGITRAQQKLYLTHAYSRMIYGRCFDSEKSRFIKEIPSNLIKKIKKK